jgi:sugar/nucleoside kinase (ribokinase family)
VPDPPAPRVPSSRPDESDGIATTRAGTAEAGNATTEVVCVGHAIVDRLAHVEAATVDASGVEPESMTLVDGEQIARIVELVGGWVQVAGGSAANTAAGLASLGGRTAFIGSVGSDALGERYERDLSAVGVRCVLGHGTTGLPTGQCLVLVTADSLRTMATNLGAGVAIDLEAVERAGVASAAAVYIEGYLLDSPGTFAALDRVIELGKAAGALVALSLSDPFLVERHGDALNELVAGKVDVLFANEEEARRFTGAADLCGALEALERPGLVVAVTLGSKGAVLLNGKERASVEAWSVGPVDDTTGAGDLFAAGVLHGIVRGAPLEVAGRLGALAAAEIVSHLGAQPQISLQALAIQAGLGGPF